MMSRDSIAINCTFGDDHVFRNCKLIDCTFGDQCARCLAEMPQGAEYCPNPDCSGVVIYGADGERIDSEFDWERCA